MPGTFRKSLLYDVLIRLVIFSMVTFSLIAPDIYLDEPETKTIVASDYEKSPSFLSHIFGFDVNVTENNSSNTIYEVLKKGFSLKEYLPSLYNFFMESTLRTTRLKHIDDSLSIHPFYEILTPPPNC